MKEQPAEENNVQAALYSKGHAAINSKVQVAECNNAQATTQTKSRTAAQSKAQIALQEKDKTVSQDKVQATIHIMGMGLKTPSTWCKELGDLEKNYLEQAEVLIGGAAQLAPFAEHPAAKIYIQKSLDEALQQMESFFYQQKKQLMLCSGDPLFYSSGIRVIEYFGLEHCVIFPNCSSMQGAASLLGLRLEDLLPISVHGRNSFLTLAHALLQEKNILLLSDARMQEQALGRYLYDRGYEDYQIHVLRHLYLDEKGQVQAKEQTRYSVQEALHIENSAERKELTVFALLKTEEKTEEKNRKTEKKSGEKSSHIPRQHKELFGLDDKLFLQENKLITKRYLRAMGLAALRIQADDTVWDIGGGSGAVSIEASRLAYKGQVCCVERDPTRFSLIQENRKHFGAANLDVFLGEAVDIIPQLPTPTKIFLGGGLGSDEESASRLLSLCTSALQKGGLIVAHCILLRSLERARRLFSSLSFELQLSHVQISEAKELGEDIYLQAQNPVYLLVASRKEKGLEQMLSTER